MAHALSETAPPAPKPPYRDAAPGGRWSDLWTRTASALVLAPIALLALWHGGLAWQITIYVALIGLGNEWARLCGLPRNSLQSLVLCPGVMVAAWLGVTFGWPIGGVALASLTLFAAWLSGRFAACGVPYAGLGGFALLWLRLHPAGLAETVFLVVTIWGTDIGAYLVGRLAGGPKMAPKISPGKTWSGSIGGLLIGAVIGALFAGNLHGIAITALPAACLLSISAQAGDLLESAIKRKLGVKDSGRTIPGHGGLFDRLDGFLAAAPLAAILVLCAGGGLPV